MIWLSVSLFSHKNQWNKLLSRAVVPFASKNAYLNGFTIEFNYLSGENIRLSLLTDEENAPELAKLADKYFNNYFLSAGLSEQELKLPVNGIFIPFPSNTIQFGLYPPKKITADKLDNYSLSLHFSQIMLYALKDDVIDDEIILTFAFYLRMGLIKMASPVYPQLVNDLKSRAIPLNAVSSKTAESKINTLKFEEVKETLIEITRDIFDVDRTPHLPVWFKQWMVICKENMNKYGDEVTASSIYIKMLSLIDTHLALSTKMDSMLTYFIDRILLYEEL